MRAVTVRAVAMTSGEVPLPRTISTRRMMLAGLKKCMPTTSDALPDAAAMASMSRVEVFDASTAPARQIFPSEANTSRLTARLSNTASITRSTGSSASMPPLVRIRAAAAAAASASSRPFSTAALKVLRTRSIPAASASGLVSTSTTSNPAVARLIAIPDPMVPAPSTPTVLTARPAAPESSSAAMPVKFPLRGVRRRLARPPWRFPGRRRCTSCKGHIGRRRARAD